MVLLVVVEEPDALCLSYMGERYHSLTHTLSLAYSLKLAFLSSLQLAFSTTFSSSFLAPLCFPPPLT